tara:strand:- start:1054 stop:1479 length:426 start_codon:yes stop_codon:yes gene_type:complete
MSEIKPYDQPKINKWLTDYACLTDNQLIKRGAQAAKKGAQRAVNPLTERQARLWTYGWNKQHGECKGCEQCHNVGTLRMPGSYFAWIKIWPKLEKLFENDILELKTMTFEDLILEANAREEAVKMAAAKAKEANAQVKKNA